MPFRELINKYIMEMPPETAQQSSGTTAHTATPVSSGSGPATQPVTYPTLAAATPGVDSNLLSNCVGKIQAAYSKSSTAALVIQFTETLETLKESITEEGNRFRTAAKLVHTTPQQLADAYHSLIGVIDGEDKHFSEIIEGQRTVEIKQRETSVTSINSEIEAANNQIQALMLKRDTITGEIVALRNKLDTAKNSFDGAAQSLRTGIEDSIRKVSIYLTTPATK